MNNLAGITVESMQKCYWTGSTCRNLKCQDAAVTINTDPLCDKHMTGCVTNGKGCVASTDPCSAYEGR